LPTIEVSALSEKTHLSKRVTVRDYLILEREQDRESIADFILSRFTERYFTPIDSASQKHGFCTMAISCLMIEALESFRRGWPDSQGHSKKTFEYFFESDPELKSIPAGAFYTHVRCGILHQAETTGGWKILRIGPLFDPASLTLNATNFHRRLKHNLIEYCSELRKADWNSPTWDACRKKMAAIIQNCASS
jgi:hypothetical protein